MCLQLEVVGWFTLAKTQTTLRHFGRWSTTSSHRRANVWPTAKSCHCEPTLYTFATVGPTMGLYRPKWRWADNSFRRIIGWPKGGATEVCYISGNRYPYIIYVSRSPFNWSSNNSYDYNIQSTAYSLHLLTIPYENYACVVFIRQKSFQNS